MQQTMDQATFEAAVTAPVRRALGFLVVRGAGSFAVAVLAVLPIVATADPTVHQIGHALLPALLAFVIVARGVHVAISRDRPDGRRAWELAAAIDQAEAWLAAAVAVLVPIAWIVGGTAILVHHLADPPPTPGAIVAVYAPSLVLLWTLATIAWAGDCRERLARALAESDRQRSTLLRRIATGQGGNPS
jgi:hypothetical protein